jgi:UDP:flavonoid glycosyltransferase YjiC (YdhE family)
MASIVFVLAPSVASLNSSLKLAKTLRSSGHRINYVGLADSEELVCANKMPFIKIYERWFPKEFGNKEDVITLPIDSLNKKTVQTGVSREQAFFSAILREEDTEFQDTMDSLRPDLVLYIHADSLMIVLALLGHSLGLNAAYLRDMLGRSEHKGVPPIWTGIIPSASIYSWLSTQIAWRKYDFYRLYERLFFRNGFEGMVKELAKKCQYSWSRVDKGGLPPYTLELPELVLCPKGFDFPHSDKPGRHYIEASIDLDRNEGSFDWGAIDEKLPLVYCALGTINWFSVDRYLAFYQSVIDVARLRPDLQWILVIGKAIPRHLNEVPPNVVIVNFVPQLQMLKRARIMITHGGTGTIKECIYYGVPMVVYPLGWDQYGNAARVVFHGMGVRGDFLNVAAEKMKTLIERVDGDPRYRQQVKLMQEKFHAAEDAQLGLKMINELLQRQAQTIKF